VKEDFEKKKIQFLKQFIDHLGLEKNDQQATGRDDVAVCEDFATFGN
jgi:hypothetical protein